MRNMVQWWTNMVNDSFCLRLVSRAPLSHHLAAILFPFSSHPQLTIVRPDYRQCFSVGYRIFYEWDETGGRIERKEYSINLVLRGQDLRFVDGGRHIYLSCQ
jgi:hypothetical protein